MDSSDSQFNKWNDFDLSQDLIVSSNELDPQTTIFNFVNEFFPIFKVFNRFNPSILNVCTDSKQLFPISIDSTKEKRDKSNTVQSFSLQHQSERMIDVVDESND